MSFAKWCSIASVVISMVLPSEGLTQTYGCTSPFAPNYNPLATVDDFTCDYDVQALFDDGYCIAELLEGNVQVIHMVGSEYGGGHLIDVDELGDQAMIIGSSLGSYYWGLDNVSGFNGVDVDSDLLSTLPYSGVTNTQNLVSNFMSHPDPPEAAFLAYTHVQGGYDDWVLPSVGDSEAICGYVNYNSYCSTTSTYNPWTSSVPGGSCCAYVVNGSDLEFEGRNAERPVIPVRYVTISDCDPSSSSSDIYGCTSPFAPNYNPLASVDDYTCEYDVQALLDSGYCIQELLEGNVQVVHMLGIEYGGGHLIDIDEDFSRAMIIGSSLGSFYWGLDDVSSFNGVDISPETLSAAKYSGVSNTIALVVNFMGHPDPPDAAFAAYTHVEGGYDDWVLPSVGDSEAICGYVNYNSYCSTTSTYNPWTSSVPSGACCAYVVNGSELEFESRNSERPIIPVRYVLFADCQSAFGCQDSLACNYSEQATYVADCTYPESECEYCSGESDGTGVVLGDLDADGVCDSVDVCVGDFDVCGTCNGPGAIYECGCFNIPQGNCNCDMDVLDAIGVCGGNCAADENGDGVCDIPGCTSIDACNYDPEANINDGSCFWSWIGGPCDDGDPLTFDDTWVEDCVCEGDPPEYGCLNATACNFDPEANADDGSCQFVGDPCDDGDSGTINDSWGFACNCEGESIVVGCMQSWACTFNPQANVPDIDMCQFPGDPCDDGNSDSFDDEWSDLCMCEGDILGCMDAVACNYNSASTINDGCIYVGDPCDDGDFTTGSDMWSADCECEGVALIGGCMNQAACNYSIYAGYEDNTCVFSGDPCDDLNPLTFEDVVDENCFCGSLEITGIQGPQEIALSVYPNPASGLVTLSIIRGSGPYTLRLFDVRGAEVWRARATAELTFDVSSFSGGWYTICVEGSWGVERARLIISEF